MRASLIFFISTSLCLMSITTTIQAAVEQATPELLCFDELIPSTQAGSVGKLIDFSVSPHGKAIICFNPEPSDKGEARGTVVYSSLSDLAQKETLEKMTTFIHGHGWRKYKEYEEFEARCIKALSDVVGEDCVDSVLGSDAFAATSWRLNVTNDLDFLIRNASGGIQAGEIAEEGTSIILSAATACRWQSKKALDDSRTQAERLRDEHPDIPFHIIIDTDGWKRLIAPQAAAKKLAKERKEAQIHKKNLQEIVARASAFLGLE